MTSKGVVEYFASGWSLTRWQQLDQSLSKVKGDSIVRDKKKSSEMAQRYDRVLVSAAATIELTALTVIVDITSRFLWSRCKYLS
jgi:hypothetical protein